MPHLEQQRALTFQGVPLTAGGSLGTGGRTTNTTTPDPFQRFLTNFVLNQVTGPQGQIPPETLQALSRVTQNPAVTPENFSALAAPLTESLRPGEEREQRDLMDLFRKGGAGSLRSGAFAQSARQLVGDQGNRRNQLLAANYVPLTNQLSNTQLNAIRLGLGVPEAATSSLRFPTTLASILQPLQRTEESLGVSPNTSSRPAGSSPEPFNASLQRLLASTRLSQDLANRPFASVSGF